MQGIEVLYWAISIVFCLALLFAILLWCRSWRKEEHEANTRQIQLLAREVRRLREAVELLDHTAASLHTADEQLSGQIQVMQDATRDLKRRVSEPVKPQSKKDVFPVSPAPTPVSEPADLVGDDGDDRFAQARALLQSGEDPVAVARQLDMGRAEVQMIVRMLDNSDEQT